MAHEILIVDDEADIRTIIADTLADEGYDTRVAADADSALAAIRARRPSLVLLDIWLEGSRIDGMGVLDAIRAEHPSVPVVMISGHGTIEVAVAAIRKGAYDFLEKPFQTDRLLLVCQRAVEAARLRRENEELKFRAGVDWNMVGNSAAVAHINQMIERVAPTNSRVLITGPAGAGKEVVARLIHARSLRRDGPFVSLNCATMHPERMEGELFGVDGPQRKVGTLEQAHGGTMLLDEVADMPIETQAKFLRVLQDQAVQRLNGGEPCKVDVRVIATTAKNLNELIEQGRFREDLFYRLRVVPIDVPPLRNRREDIPALARHLMTAAAQRAGLPPRQLGEDAIAALQAYNWPGNVRQLCNVIDWLLIMTPATETHVVAARQLPPEILGAEAPLPRLDRAAEIMTMPLREAREAFEREYLMAQIARFGGNISRTAGFIGMERSALHRKLKLLGVADAERGEARPRNYDA
ncbi:MAG: sigma-54-dependent Fis family transcriptional regulator [Rhodospirillaceae bacterium]|nr:sigma-54-dependent Fis family transcriptional regulator [Rhodospirillaceae bacterium]